MTFADFYVIILYIQLTLKALVPVSCITYCTHILRGAVVQPLTNIEIIRFILNFQSSIIIVIACLHWTFESVSLQQSYGYAIS